QSILSADLVRSAEWRREKAEQFPDDTRNAEAADLLDRLAGEVDALADEEVSCLNAITDGDYIIQEAYGAVLKEIGFHRWPDSGKELVADLASHIVSHAEVVA